MSPMPADRPLRVVILIAQLGRGGAERQVYELATRLDRSRVVPVIVTFDPDVEYRTMLSDAGIEVIALGKSGLREPLALARLTSLLRARRFDLVHAYLFSASWRAVLAARLARVRPVICAVRSTSVAMSRRLKAMERVTLRSADLVIANAPSVRDDIAARTGIPAGRIRVILNGVDTTAYRPGESTLRKEWTGGADGGPLVGFVGGFREAKDPCLFVRIAARVARAHPSVRFVMVGDGLLRREVESEIERSGVGDRMTLAGVRPDVPEVFRALDVAVVTSYREGCCNAILEAMATGLPVVATAVGGNPDIVEEGGTGRLFPHGDVAAGADAILGLLSHPGEAARLGARAVERARRDFSMEAMVRATTDLYGDLA